MENACAVDIVLASEGYPATHSSGEEIVGLEEAKRPAASYSMRAV